MTEDCPQTTVTHVYNERGLLAEVTDSAFAEVHGGGTLRYDYDDNGNRIKISGDIPDSMEYSHDSLNRISTVQVDNDRPTRYFYGEDGALRQWILPNGLVTEYQHDEEMRIQNQKSWLVQTDLLENDEISPETFIKQVYAATYEYSSSGNIIRIAGLDNNQRDYEYDAAGRLVSENIISLSIQDMGDAVEVHYVYEYDSVGNRLFLRENRKGVDFGSVTTSLFNEANQHVASFTVDYNSMQNASFSHYSFDKSGNRIAEYSQINDLRKMTRFVQYDALNRLLVSADGSISRENKYRGLFFKKIAKTERLNSTVISTNNILYDGDNAIVEVLDNMHLYHVFNVQTLLFSFHFHEDSTLDKQNTEIAFFENVNVAYPLYDHLGTTLGFYSHAGELLQNYTINAFGVQLDFNSRHYSQANDSTYWLMPKFTGKILVSTIFPYYDFKYRSYSPIEGTFLQRDPYPFHVLLHTESTDKKILMIIPFMNLSRIIL